MSSWIETSSGAVNLFGAIAALTILIFSIAQLSFHSGTSGAANGHEHHDIAGSSSDIPSPKRRFISAFSKASLACTFITLIAILVSSSIWASIKYDPNTYSLDTAYTRLVLRPGADSKFTNFLMAGEAVSSIALGLSLSTAFLILASWFRIVYQVEPPSKNAKVAPPSARIGTVFHLMLATKAWVIMLVITFLVSNRVIPTQGNTTEAEEVYSKQMVFDGVYAFLTIYAASMILYCRRSFSSLAHQAGMNEDLIFNRYLRKLSQSSACLSALMFLNALIAAVLIVNASKLRAQQQPFSHAVVDGAILIFEVTLLMALGVGVEVTTLLDRFSMTKAHHVASPLEDSFSTSGLSDTLDGSNGRGNRRPTQPHPRQNHNQHQHQKAIPPTPPESIAPLTRPPSPTPNSHHHQHTHQPHGNLHGQNQGMMNQARRPTIQHPRVAHPHQNMPQQKTGPTSPASPPVPPRRGGKNNGPLSPSRNMTPSPQPTARTQRHNNNQQSPAQAPRGMMRPTVNSPSPKDSFTNMRQDLMSIYSNALEDRSSPVPTARRANNGPGAGVGVVDLSSPPDRRAWERQSMVSTVYAPNQPRQQSPNAATRQPPVQQRSGNAVGRSQFSETASRFKSTFHPDDTESEMFDGAADEDVWSAYSDDLEEYNPAHV